MTERPEHAAEPVSAEAPAPTAPPMDAEERAVAELYARAREQGDAGEMAAAISSYKSLLARAPGHVRARNNLALLLEKRGDLDGALAELDKALAAEPENVSVLCNRAAVLSSRLRYEQAESDLRRALKLEENNAEVLTNIGVLKCKRARWREAIEPLQRAVQLDPERPVAHYYLGEAFNHVDQLPAALASFEAAARLQPTNWRAFKGVGIILDRMGRPEEAAAAYKRAGDAHRR